MTNPTPLGGDLALEPGPTIGNYGKAINATIILVLGVLGSALADGSINTVEWLMALIALLGGAANVVVPLRYGFLNSYGKLILTALIAAVTQVITALQDGGGIQGAEWMFVFVTFFTALGSVYSTSNAALSDALRTDDALHPIDGAGPVDVNGDGRDDKTGRFV